MDPSLRVAVSAWVGCCGVRVGTGNVVAVGAGEQEIKRMASKRIRIQKRNIDM